MIRILSIDGGGVRGIIPAMMLVEIERRAGIPISQLFDLIAGSSTGGLIALTLARPELGGAPTATAEGIARLYEEFAPAIFQYSRKQWVNSFGNLRKYKYSDDALNAMLDDYFRDIPLSAATTEVLITAYEIQRREPWFFRRNKARETFGCEFSMRDVARATVAAPTYFVPAAVSQCDSEMFYAL